MRRLFAGAVVDEWEIQSVACMFQPEEPFEIREIVKDLLFVQAKECGISCEARGHILVTAHTNIIVEKLKPLKGKK